MGFEILADTQIILKKKKKIYYDKVSAFFPSKFELFKYPKWNKCPLICRSAGISFICQ